MKRIARYRAIGGNDENRRKQITEEDRKCRLCKKSKIDLSKETKIGGWRKESILSEVGKRKLWMRKIKRKRGNI